MKAACRAGFIVLELLYATGVSSVVEVEAIAKAVAEEVRTPIYPQGLGIGLIPPVDMVESRRFPGFEDEARESAIIMAEMPPELYAKLEKDLREPEHEPGGFELIRREAWPVEGGKGLLVEAKQELNGKIIYKWVLARGTGALATAVTFQVSEKARDVYTDDVVLQSLRSLTTRDHLALQAEMKTLPFILDDSVNDSSSFPVFRVSRIIPGNSVMLTLGPKDLVQDAEQPVIIIGGSTAAIAGALEQDRFARQAFGSLTGVRGLEIRRGEGITRDGSAWHEIEADGQGIETGTSVKVLQAIRFDRAQLVRFVIIARQEAWDDTLLYFDHLRDSTRVRYNSEIQPNGDAE